MQGNLANDRVYGYTNPLVEDTTSKGKWGRPFVVAVNLEINPAEAAIVVRIFELYVSGCGCLSIAQTLNKEGISPPF